MPITPAAPTIPSLRCTDSMKHSVVESKASQVYFVLIKEKSLLMNAPIFYISCGSDGDSEINEERSNNPVNTPSYVQILGNGMDTQDTSPSVLLFFGTERYVFNVGEEVKIWGPKDLNYLAAAMQHFISDNLMEQFDWPGRVHDSNGDANSTSQKIDDHHILLNNGFVKISAIVLQPSQSESDVSGKNPASSSVIYICELQEIKRKFDAQKADSLGLKCGPKRGKLQGGEPVQSDLLDIMIHPDDVLGPSVPGPIVLLIDCPTLLHLQELLSVQSFSRYYADTAENVPNSSKNVNCVIHLSPAHVTKTDDYQIWMSRFGAAQHIMAGHEINLGLDRSCLPNLTSPQEIIHELQSKKQKIMETSSEKACVQATVVVTKRPRLNRSALPDCMEGISRDVMEIVILGTGSSQPSMYRNVSSVFLNLFSKGSLLLDCGEATLGQLKRRFGIEGADEVVRSLRCIWISHIHADHHTGLARILVQRRDLLKGIPHDPLIVIGPVQLKDYLNAYERLEHLDMQFLDCEHTKESNTIVESLKKVLVEAGLETLISVPVEHCEPAYGVVLKAANRVNRVGKMIPGWKLVYSGDTRPCHELIQASEEATVLIHEATFEDDLLDEAKAKNHSTFSEALGVGDLCGVYRVILTHFSQRYPKIPKFDETKFPDYACVAFDLMSVNLADLLDLRSVMENLKPLFLDEK
ncbi:hypothetical protein DH2020_024517 [Rehmannia glutinosa]|uniref:ribonuclease Z n=1 Tax=Rehmannia glutinosa TaxID=99300 RepID=A0ABR0W268_REHGL